MNNKLEKKVKNEKIVLLVIFILALLSFCLDLCFLETQFYVPKSFISGEVIKYLFFIIIVGSSIYSSLIVKNDLIYDLMFGITRKDFYKNYIKKIFLILALLLIFVLAYIFVIWYYNQNINISKYILEKGKIIFGLSAVYLLFNSFTFFLTDKVKKWFMEYIYLIILILSIFLLFIDLNNLIMNTIIIFLSLNIMLLNYILLKKKKIE